MNKTKAWLTALRLRTLPLSVSGVIAGSLIALSKSIFDGKVFCLALLTTLLLQILSNLANDYGDSQNGADTPGRIGPVRMVQSGVISAGEMKKMILVFSCLAGVTGISLLMVSQLVLFSVAFFILGGLGFLAIGAALAYTIGRKPYGYYGWGDLAVFLFFGLLSVAGTYYLHAGDIPPAVFLPAVSIGALSVGVLNINNMRDHENDRVTGKNTVVVKIGFARAKYYHAALLAVALNTSLLYLLVCRVSAPGCLLFILIVIPLTAHLRRVFRIQDPSRLDGELRKLALTTILFSLALGTALNI